MLLCLNLTKGITTRAGTKRQGGSTSKTSEQSQMLTTVYKHGQINCPRASNVQWQLSADGGGETKQLQMVITAGVCSSTPASVDMGSCTCNL